MTPDATTLCDICCHSTSNSHNSIVSWHRIFQAGWKWATNWLHLALKASSLISFNNCFIITSIFIVAVSGWNRWPPTAYRSVNMSSRHVHVRDGVHLSYCCFRRDGSCLLGSGACSDLQPTIFMSPFVNLIIVYPFVCFCHYSGSTLLLALNVQKHLLFVIPVAL